MARSPEREDFQAGSQRAHESISERMLNVQLLAGQWRHILIAGLLPIMVAACVAVFSPKTYRSRVLMVPTIAQSQQASAGVSVASGLSSIAARFGLGDLGGSSNAEQEAIATLTSRAFLEAFIKDKDLLPVLFADDWDPKQKAWIVDEPPTYGQAYRRLIEDVLDVRKDLRTGLVTLTVEWRDRQLATEWANELVARVNEIMRQRAITEASASLKYLSRELGASNQIEVREALYRIMEFHLTNATLANVQTQYAFRIIDPAVASDEDDFVSPRRLVIMAVGIVLGVFAGACVAGLALTRNRSTCGVTR